MKTANTELQLIIAILANQNEVVLAQVLQQVDFDWELFYRLVIIHRVWYQVYAWLREHQEKSHFKEYIALANQSDEPHPVMVCLQKMQQLCNQDKLKILSYAGETVRISKVFQEKYILHAVLKGVTLNTQIYPKLISRPCKDIDIWISLNDYQIAMDTLCQLGYQQTNPQYKLESFKKRYYLAHRHDIEFYHPERKVYVELLFQMNYHEAIIFYPLNLQLLNQISILKNNVYVLKDDIHLLYLMIHAANHAYVRLRWLYDIALYLQSGQCDLSNVYTCAKELCSTHIVELAVILVYEKFKLDSPQVRDIVARAGSQARRLSVMVNYLLEQQYETAGVSGIWNNGFFVSRVYMLLLAIKGQKQSALLHELFRIDLMFPTIDLPGRLVFLYYIIYPFWILKRAISPVFRFKR